MTLLQYHAKIPESKPSLKDQDVNNTQVRHALEETLEANQGHVKKAKPITTVRLHGEQEHIVRLAEKRVDPLDPPRFRNRKVLALQRDDPAPILTTPIEKLTPEEQKYWTVPACVSNWKNPEGYVIPMDKRVGADARRFEQPQLSTKFAPLAEALDVAVSSINASIAQRARVQRTLAMKKQMEQEEQLREEAKQLREAKREIDHNKTQEERRRDRFLQEQRDERQRIRRQTHERDISERIALGQTVTNTAIDDEFDIRLFDKSSGLDSGVMGEEDNQVYDRPMFHPNHEYVPFAGDRKYGASREDKYEVPVGDEEEKKDNSQNKSNSLISVRFQSGPSQTPSERAGLYYPSGNYADSESDMDEESD